MAAPVMHFEITVDDVATARSFYRRLFDWEVGPDDPSRYGLVETNGGGGIGGGIGTGKPTGIAVYVQVPDLQTTLDKAVRLGGQTLMPPTAISAGETIAVMADPEGNRIGLIKG